ncbi:MAG: AgmX/PglI C-terminal domain-containing protein [Polyangiaceae bacterium]|nr:AgmX/PglI C-terminal domain-containing protein [Polyangiaceae bacterium]
MRSQAGLARGCYQKALRDDAAPTGTLTVAVSVGADGSVCGTSIVSDTVGSSAIASCVLGKFQGRTYPRPTSGCVVLQVPIAFAAK